MTSTVPFITHLDAARVARVAAQTPGALSGIKSVAAYFDKRLASDPIGAITSAELDRVFKFAMARAEARGDRQESWELDSLAQKIAAQAPAVDRRNLFSEFEKLAHTIKTEDQYWLTLKRLGHADDSLDSRRAQLYLRAFVLQAQGLPVGEEPAETKWVIVKSSRSYYGGPGYNGPACARAGVSPSQVYESKELAERDAARLNQVNPIGFTVRPYRAEEPESEKWVIVKSSRSYYGGPGYNGPSCARAGVSPSQIYEDKELAERDAAKLNNVNPIGFSVRPYQAPRTAQVVQPMTTEPIDTDLDADGVDALPEAGMPEHEEMTETHAEGRSPHTGQPIIVELGALEDYDVAPKVAQVGRSLKIFVGPTQVKPLATKFEEAGLRVQGGGTEHIYIDSPEGDLYEASNAVLSALKSNLGTTFGLTAHDMTFSGPLGRSGQVIEAPDATAVGESFGDGMDVIITIEDPTAPGKYLDLKVAPHVTEDNLGQMSDESFSEALDGGADAQGYADYDVYAAPTEGDEDTGELKGSGSSSAPLRLAEFRSQSVIAAVTRVASTLLRGYTGRVQKIAEGALITVDSPAADGRNYSVLIGRRGAIARSAQYGWLALPPSQPGPRSMIDKQMISRGTNTQQMEAPAKAAQDGSETDSPTGRDHTDEHAHNKEVEVTINADTDECADADSMCAEDYERRASVLAEAGLLISDETIERELLRGAEVRVASARISITQDDIVQIRRGSVTMPGKPLRDIDSALAAFRLAAGASAKAAQLEAALERTHGVRVLEVRVPGASLADRHINAKKIATALKRIARPLRILAAGDKSSLKIELAGVSPAREKHIEGLIKTKYRTAMAWAAQLGPAAVGAVEKVAPGVLPHVKPLDPAGKVDAAPKGTDAELKDKIQENLDPLDPAKGAPKVGQIAESPGAGDISMIHTDEGIVVQLDGEPPMGPFGSIQDAEDNVRLLLKDHPDAAVFYGTDKDPELQPHMLSAQRKLAQVAGGAAPGSAAPAGDGAPGFSIDDIPAPVPGGVIDPGSPQAPNPEVLPTDGSAVDSGGGSAGLDFSEPLTPEGRKVIESALQTYRNQNLGPVEAQVQFLKDFREFFNMAGEEGSERRMMAEAALMGIVADIWQKPVIRPDQMFARPEGMPALFEADAAEESGAGLDMGGTDPQAPQA